MVLRFINIALLNIHWANGYLMINSCIAISWAFGIGWQSFVYWKWDSMYVTSQNVVADMQYF